MQRYELEDIKRSTEYILDEIVKSLDIMSNSASDVGLNKSNADMFLSEVKSKLYDFYAVFITAVEEQKHKIEKEEETEV